MSEKRNPWVILKIREFDADNWIIDTRHVFCRHGLASGCPRCVEEDDRVEEAYYAPLEEEIETLGDDNA